MLGKRTRSYAENSGSSLDKKQKTSTQANAPLDTQSASTRTQSKCNTPDDIISQVLPNVTLINTTEGNQQAGKSEKVKMTLKQQLIYLYSTLIDEYNCNHQQDLDSETQVEIYTRDREKKYISDFIDDSIKSKKSALLYLCGHPGTGKTSTLHSVLSKVKQNPSNSQLYQNCEIMLYNAMSFRDVRKFCLRLLKDLNLLLTGEAFDESNYSKNKIDDEDLSNLIAKNLIVKPNLTKIIVIDEIDTFETYQSSFLTMVKAILASKSNTVLIGIANSVDLPFKKKHSAIAMRDLQLLFEPYDEEQIIEILEKKTNMKYNSLPEIMRKNEDIKDVFFDLLEEKASKFIAVKVSRMNGDLRVAFDLVKSCFVYLQQELMMDKSEEVQINKQQVKSLMVAKVFELKYGSKLPETLRKLPRQNLIILEVIAYLYENESEDRKFTYHDVYNKLGLKCKEHGLGKIAYSEMDSVMEVLQNYNIIEIDRTNKLKDSKTQKFCLKVEAAELFTALNNIIQMRGGISESPSKK